MLLLDYSADLRALHPMLTLLGPDLGESSKGGKLRSFWAVFLGQGLNIGPYN